MSSWCDVATGAGSWRLHCARGNCCCGHNEVRLLTSLWPQQQLPLAQCSLATPWENEFTMIACHQSINHMCDCVLYIYTIGCRLVFNTLILIFWQNFEAGYSSCSMQQMIRPSPSNTSSSLWLVVNEVMHVWEWIFRGYLIRSSRHFWTCGPRAAQWPLASKVMSGWPYGYAPVIQYFCENLLQIFISWSRCHGNLTKLWTAPYMVTTENPIAITFE